MSELNLLLCPFCDADLEPFGPAQHNHPVNDCWLSTVKIEQHEYAAWNRRATQPANTDADGQRYRDLIASSPRQEISFLGREYFGKAALDAAIDAARLTKTGAHHE